VSYIAEELRELRKEVVRLNRKLALHRIPGKVAERDPQKRKVRLEIGEDPDTGKKILGPWVRVQSVSAGKFKFFVLPSVGEQMYQESPSGVVGADTVAVFGTFDDENKHPEQEPDELVIENDTTRFSLKKGQIHLKVDGTAYTFKKEGFEQTGGHIKHDNKKIDSTHKHIDVEPGGGKSGPPE
jgi:phage baseplate assembly protein gpV